MKNECQWCFAKIEPTEERYRLQGNICTQYFSRRVTDKKVLKRLINEKTAELNKKKLSTQYIEECIKMLREDNKYSETESEYRDRFAQAVIDYENEEDRRTNVILGRRILNTNTTS